MYNNLFDEVCTEDRNINLETLNHVLSLAVEIAIEGREGRKIGTMFIVSDEKNVLDRSKCLILDPLQGHPEEFKYIKSPDMRETIKELSQMDGAFIISDTGVVISSCRYINASSKKVNLPLGLGTRHMAAASITLETNCIAVVVSESSIVRVIDNGEIVSEIIPELWMLKENSIHVKGEIIEKTEENVTVISKVD